MDELIKYSPYEMEGLMKVNSGLAEKNFMRHLQWSGEHNLQNSKQALHAYDGAVFQGINADDFSEEELVFADKHIRILSGLYGVLKPLDIIQPYRLEMGTKFSTQYSKDLYVFWQDKLTDYFEEEMKKQNYNVIINLASREYSSAINLNRLHARVVTPVFKDYKRGVYKIITIYAKRARGLMSRFMTKNKIVMPEDLKAFDEEGYRYMDSLSSEDEWVFIR
ncbi:hypothetical protein OXPF_43450 [Oxobacter pfennigii]|uniref:UPF0246 protein OXPF_43450 n=2 Tax=Oxobacter pfennigii TaxID=36849 RepID=A0A0N8NSN9_9CLOT|nr:hypothetical protein OXPF_43450 [Oxobacter pfennigii]